jgi:hypothetical protein
VAEPQEAEERISHKKAQKAQKKEVSGLRRESVSCVENPRLEFSLPRLEFSL